MQKSTEKTLKYAGIGVLGFYLLSKMNLAGKIGEGLGGALGDVLGGAGDIVTEVAGGIGGGLGDLTTDVVWNAPSQAGSNFLASIVNLFSPGTGTYWQKTGTEVTQKEGLGVVFWNRDKINAYYMPGAEKVNPESGYSNVLGYTWLTPAGQTKAAQLNSIAVAHPTWQVGDIAYAWAAAAGQDMTNWNLSGLTPAFKQEVGIT